MQIVLDSEVWTISEDGSIDLNDEADGDTDFSTHMIVIHPTLCQENRLEALVHEMIHASCVWLAEDTVTRLASDMSRVLYRQYKYRCFKKEKETDDDTINT